MSNKTPNRRIISREEINRTEPELSEGQTLKGMLTHKPDSVDQGGTRTGGPVRRIDPV